MTSNIWHCFCTYCTKEHRCLLHFSTIMSQRLVVHKKQCWKQEQKYVMLCYKLQDQDQRYKTKTKTKAGLRPVLS